jgi:hypothetical protein
MPYVYADERHIDTDMGDMLACLNDDNFFTDDIDPDDVISEPTEGSWFGLDNPSINRCLNLLHKVSLVSNVDPHDIQYIRNFIATTYRSK